MADGCLKNARLRREFAVVPARFPHGQSDCRSWIVSGARAIGGRLTPFAWSKSPAGLLPGTGGHGTAHQVRGAVLDLAQRVDELVGDDDRQHAGTALADAPRRANRRFDRERHHGAQQLAGGGLGSGVAVKRPCDRGVGPNRDSGSAKASETPIEFCLNSWFRWATAVLQAVGHFEPMLPRSTYTVAMTASRNRPRVSPAPPCGCSSAGSGPRRWRARLADFALSPSEGALAR
jgi:hypothetical protein